MADIFASDYNSIRNTIVSVLGTGADQTGYGQTVQSSAISKGMTITAQQWDDLRFDIVSVKVHQDGVLPTITDVSRSDLIGSSASAPKIQYNSLVTSALRNKFLIGQAQFALADRGTVSYSSSWSTQLSCVVTATFANSDDARYFFNSGGKIRFFSSRTGGSTTPQNNSWSGLLSSIGTVSFGAATGLGVSYYDLTNSYLTFFAQAATSTYASNNYSIEAKCNVASNVSGTATVIDFRIKWTDGYVDPDTLNPLPSPPSFSPADAIDGTLVLQVDELKASGNLFPSGTFTITSPSYSITSISGS